MAIKLTKSGESRLSVSARNFAKRFGLSEEAERNLKECMRNQIVNEVESLLPTQQSIAAKIGAYTRRAKKRIEEREVIATFRAKKKPVKKK